ncbi:MAG: hypothetical protein R3B91_19515 [Planctomycetaceae bacterium]
MSESPSNGNLGRRDVLKGAVASSLGLTMAATTAPAQQVQQASSLIQRENERPGTTDWQLTRVRINQESSHARLLRATAHISQLQPGRS